MTVGVVIQFKQTVVMRSSRGSKQIKKEKRLIAILLDSVGFELRPRRQDTLEVLHS